MEYYEMTGFMGLMTDSADDCSEIEMPRPEEAALLLDFDGTLVDIADRPNGIVVTSETRKILAQALERLDGRVAIVSGRSVAELERFLPDFAGPLIGTHGSEMRADGEHRQLVDFDRATVSRLIRLADDFAALRPEFLVEHKPSGVVLHYRQAEEHAALAMRFMESLAMAADGFRIQPALMAYEIKPEGVGKDVALERLLSTGAFAGKTPVYAGDDLTDEPALELAQDRGGVAIKVGPAETVACHRLEHPADLIRFLGGWLG
ncbi:trehalose-phosphatase [Jannaschia sp. S6380]|uniref:trehalose-phosphatase n=1 Tax=Jannaschia sp. S6380 TaxID=2926408 RepID=UPI001FF2D8D8|nr:trehalose-phosphatase [Jannaschia sp. S6380]MCK0168392.1 trehalose-phosphatase [Jannaschia sp. S6380]